MAKTTFNSWLKVQEYRSDPVGFLARFWAEITPGRVSSVAGISRVLREIAESDGSGATPGRAQAALEAMTAAVDEYEHRDDPRPPLAAVPDAGPGRADDEGTEPPADLPPHDYVLHAHGHGGHGYEPLEWHEHPHDGPGHSGLQHSHAHRHATASTAPGPQPSLPAHDAQGRYDGASALTHQSGSGYARDIPPTRWQVTSAPQGTLEAISTKLDTLIASVIGLADDALGIYGPHLPAIRRALEFAYASANMDDAMAYAGALAALFPADYGMPGTEETAEAFRRAEAGNRAPAPDDFAGLWAAADFSEADR